MALRAYSRAEQRFREIQRRKDALDAEERVILHIWAMKLSKASIGLHDQEGFQASYLSLGERRAKLFEPWQTANADLVSAYERAQRVLQEIGFETPDVPRSVSSGDMVTEKPQ
ncbi:hypothetical protein CFBP4996_26165 (plasmid) [Agrobacterium leguminum]|uniref:hypothetical protein n=1 Tax=Agrobacterium leguminum TaxID=2792015 RepID=UPI0010C96DBE|nr:hypothetical protein [Agrobacterium leguminum]WFS69561.1 hypothetical protein CFBP4996_26165 [Agrobacterium leguminum]